MLTQTEENYLKSIYHLYESIQSPVSTNAIAGQLKTTAASVTDMMKKLASKKLIHYEKYKGAKLTQDGYAIATNLIRKHRLWETFLVEKLDFTWGEVHDIAEQLEHIKSAELIDRLDAFLDFPKFDPHGDPIPNSDGKFTLRDQVSMDIMKPGDKGVLVGVKKHDPSFLKHLDEKGIALGKEIEVNSVNSYDRSLVLKIDRDETTISAMVSKSLLIKRIKQDD